MSNNNYDVTVIPKGEGWQISVSYWYYNRNKANKKMTSGTSYTWYTDCKEIIKLLQERRTKVFYSQIRVMARNFGRKERQKFI